MGLLKNGDHKMSKMTQEKLLEVVRDSAKDYAERLAKAGFTMQEARFIQPSVKELFQQEHDVKLEGILNGYFKATFWQNFKPVNN